jgi:hypothetical protein
MALIHRRVCVAVSHEYVQVPAIDSNDRDVDTTAYESTYTMCFHGVILSVHPASSADVASSTSVQKKNFEFSGDENRVGPLLGFIFPPPAHFLLPAHFSLSPGSERHPLPLASLSVTATNGTPHHHRRRPPATQLKIRQRRPPNATRGSLPTTPTRSDREPPTVPPPTSTIDSGHKVLSSDDPSQDPTPNGLLSSQFSLPHKQNPEEEAAKAMPPGPGFEAAEPETELQAPSSTTP